MNRITQETGVKAVGAAPPPEMVRRMEAMMLADRIWAYGFVVALIIVYAFVFFATLPYISDFTTIAVLIGGGILVVLYNSASMHALSRHYGEDRDYIYGLDIRHLDQMQAAKAARRRG